MATEKTLKTRVKMKHGKESEWALATKFIPLIGEIIVYDVDNNHTSPRFKVGDGLTNVNNLKFVNQDELAKITTLGDELLAVKNGYLPLSGGTITGALNIKNGTRFSEMHFAPSFDSSYAGVISYDAGDTNKYGSSTHIFIRQYSITTGSTSSSGMSKYESFSFPSTASGLTANIEYTIFTTKNPPTATQVGALPIGGGTLTGGLTATGNVFSKGQLVSQTNSYPGLVIQNASAANLAMLYSNGTTGDYSNIYLRVYDSSSAYSSFAFGKDGSLSFGGKLYNSGGQTAKTFTSGGGTTGYFKFATIKISAAYQNQTIRMAIAQRAAYGDFKLTFANVSTSDPSIYTFVKTGNIGVYAHKSATSTWDLYLLKTESYDQADVTIFENGCHNGGFSLTFVDTCVSALPSGYITASAETWNGAAASANTLNNTLSADKGGTGCSSLRAAGKAIINALDLGTAQPFDGDYYICQSVGGGTTDTEYVRRPMSALWNYIKSKGNSTYLPLTGGTLTGTLTAKALYASDGNVVGSHLVTQTNNYPEVYFKNAAGATLADLWVNTTTGSYAPVILRVHADASTSKDFTFEKDGTFSIPNSFSTVMGEIKSNAWPQLFFRNGNGNNLAQLVIPTNNGSYSGLVVNVFSDASNHVQYTFNSDGTFVAPAGITTNGNYVSIKNNSYPQLTFSSASGADIGKFFVSTTNGSYAATKIRAYSSASSYYDFQFLGTGSFSCKTINADGIDIGADSLVQLSQNDNKGSGCISIGNINLGDWRVISVADDGRLLIDYTNPIYALGSSVIYSSSQPSSPTTGMIWLKPV